MTVEAVGMAADRARLDTLRLDLGDQLANYRRTAGFSQRTLGEAIGRSRTMVSRVEAGKRGMPATEWTVADEVCRADGALVTAHGVLAKAERDHRARVRVQHRESQRAAAQVEVDALRASPASQLRVTEHEAGPELARVESELVEELMQVVTKLARLMGRRDAMRVAGLAFAAVGLSGVDVDECARVARALATPQRVDAKVVESLAVMLAHCKRQEDTLGPAAVVKTVVAQYDVVQGLLVPGGCPEGLTRPLLVVQSDMASTIGCYLEDMGNYDAAQRYFQEARKAGHDARNAACAAYAVASMSHLAFLRGEAHTAMDTAAAARSLAARTDDLRLKVLAELMAAAAYALDGQHGLCLTAYARAKELISGNTVSAANSLAYGVNEAWLDSKLSTYLSRLDRPGDAVEAARNALARFDRRLHRRYVEGHAFATVRFGAALVLAEEIGEAARVLGDAASVASLAPRLTAELRAARAGMRQWEGTRAVKALDEQLAASGLVLPGARHRSQSADVSE